MCKEVAEAASAGKYHSIIFPKGFFHPQYNHGVLLRVGSIMSPSCPKCGYFSDDYDAPCRICGTKIVKPEIQYSSGEFSSEIKGEKPYDVINLSFHHYRLKGNLNPKPGLYHEIPCKKCQAIILADTYYVGDKWECPACNEIQDFSPLPCPQKGCKGVMKICGGEIEYTTYNDQSGSNEFGRCKKCGKTYRDGPGLCTGEVCSKCGAPRPANL